MNVTLTIQEKLKDLRTSRGLNLEPLAEHLTTALEQAERYKGSPSEMYLMLICKVLRLNFRKLTEEDKQWLTRIAQKSSLLKNPIPQRGKR